MELKVGAPFELVWRNDELDRVRPASGRPASPSEHRMQSRITELDPPRKLAFSLAKQRRRDFRAGAQGQEVLLTVIHAACPIARRCSRVSAGWHMHLDVLVARATGKDRSHSGTAGAA